MICRVADKDFIFSYIRYIFDIAPDADEDDIAEMLNYAPNSNRKFFVAGDVTVDRTDGTKRWIGGDEFVTVMTGEGWTVKDIPALPNFQFGDKLARKTGWPDIFLLVTY